MTIRLKVYNVQDHFGPVLFGDPYWHAEVYDDADYQDRELWVAGYGSWLEAMRGGLLALAEKSADVAVPLMDGLPGGAEGVADLLPGETGTAGAVDPVDLHRGELGACGADLGEAGEVVVVADDGVDGAVDAGCVDVHASRLPDAEGGCQESLTGSRSQFWDDLNKDLRDPEFRDGYVDESLRIEWERGMARQAMDVGPICTCGHGQLEHGETRCKRCGCNLAWWSREFADEEGQSRRVPLCGACGGPPDRHYAMCDFTDGSAVR